MTNLIKKYEELNKRIQELKSNPDRKAIRKFVVIREDINTDKVFTADTQGKYRKAIEKCTLYICFDDLTFEVWTAGSKSTYLPDSNIPYNTSFPFISGTEHNGKEVYEKMLEFSECKDGYASEQTVYPVRLGGDFHELVSDYLIEKYNLNKDEL